jgi:hypothetical protein
MFSSIFLKASRPVSQARFLLLGGFSAAVVAERSWQQPAYADGESSSSVTQDTSSLSVSAEQKAALEKIKLGLAQDVRDSVLAATDEENAAWEAEKSGCSFCQYFLESPCAAPFRNWSRCVDLAKAQNLDYITTCSEYTNALMACTEAEAEHFEALRHVEREQSPREAAASAAEEAEEEASPVKENAAA